MEHIKTYQTEKSILLGFLMWGIVLVTFVLALISNVSIIQTIIVGLFVVFVAVVWFGTKYIIKEKLLIVKIGPFTHSKIKISAIKSIRDAKGNLIASPANSFNRISILYGKYEEILLSPKNRKALFEDLLKLNPTIKIEEGLE